MARREPPVEERLGDLSFEVRRRFLVQTDRLLRQKGVQFNHSTSRLRQGRTVVCVLRQVLGLPQPSNIASLRRQRHRNDQNKVWLHVLLLLAPKLNLKNHKPMITPLRVRDIRAIRLRHQFAEQSEVCQGGGHEPAFERNWMASNFARSGDR